MVDQTTPYGSVNWTQTGTWDDGTPRFSSTTTLSPEERAKQDQQWQFDSLINQLGIDQTKKLSGHLDRPVDFAGAPALPGLPTPKDFDPTAVEGRLIELGRRRLDPMLTERRDALENKLRNQGINPGSEAWDREIRNNLQGENDAYTSLLLSGRGQAYDEADRDFSRDYRVGSDNWQRGMDTRRQSITEILTGRNQPINEITALMSGGQVSLPQFQSTPSVNVAGTDIAGLTMDAYRMGPMAQWQAENANRQAMMGGLFGLAGAGVRGAMGGWAGR